MFDKEDGCFFKPSSLYNNRDISNASSFPVVGIGASADDLDALQHFFEQVPPDNGMAFVVIQHQVPEKTGSPIEKLQHSTSIEVLLIDNKTTIQPGYIYLLPPDKNLSIHQSQLHLSDPIESNDFHLPIDFFFRSLADERREQSIGVILSGKGSDGTLGLRAIREQGGISFVQEPTTAKVAEMPLNVINAGYADIVDHAKALPNHIMSNIRQIYLEDQESNTLTEEWQKALETIIDILERDTGHDFSHYKYNTFFRRISRRMGLNHIGKISGYVELLQQNSSESGKLVSEMLIGVTSFFRDTALWEQMAQEIFPALMERLPNGGVLRAWSAGCATGEEAYTLAICFKEALNRVQPNGNHSLQIFATDLDQTAVAKARRGIYSASAMENITPERLNRFFIAEGREIRICKEIRDMVIFAPHDLLTDPPFTRMDILSCRNLLIYLTQESHKALLPHFHFSLKPDSYLILGNSESIGESTELFKLHSSHSQLYQRLDAPLQNNRMGQLTVFPSYSSKITDMEKHSFTHLPTSENFHSLTEKLLLKSFTPAAVLVTQTGNIVHINGETGDFLAPVAGKANWNVLAMAREGLMLPLSESFHDAIRLKKSVQQIGTRKGSGGQSQWVEITVQPLIESSSLTDMLLIVFKDVKITSQVKVPAESEKSIRQSERLKFLEQCLHESKEKLRLLHEDMQSSREELTSSNEELQSTNEELTTSTEELQSMNEELARARLAAEQSLARYTDLFDSAPIGYFNLDEEGIIRQVNQTGTNLLVKGSQSCMNSRFGLFVLESDRAVFMDCLHRAFAGGETQECEVALWQDQATPRVVRIMALAAEDRKNCRVMVDDISEIKQAELDLIAQDHRFRDMVNNIDGIVWEADANSFIFSYISQQAERLLGFSIDEWKEEGFWAKHLHPEDKDWAIQFCVACTGRIVAHDFEYRFIAKDGRIVWLHDIITVIAEDGKPKWLTGIMVDITKQKQVEEALVISEDRYARAVRGTNDGLWDWDLKTDEKYLSPRWKQLLGFSEGDIIAQDELFYDRLHPEDKPVVDRALEAHFEKGEVYDVEVRLRTKKGRYHWFRTNGSADKDEQGKAVRMAGSLSDIGPRKQIESRELSRNKILELTANGASIKKILESIVKGVEQEIPSISCSILLMDIDGKHLLNGASCGLPEFYNSAVNGLEIGATAGSCGSAAFTGKRVIVDDIQSHPFWSDYRALAAQAGLAACWSEPIKDPSGKVLGTFAVYYKQSIKPDEHDIQLIEQSANLAGIAIERNRANEELLLASLVYQNSSEAMLIMDAEQRILSINPAFSEITGYSLDDVIGESPAILRSDRHTPAFYKAMYDEIEAKGRWQGEIWERRKNGEIFAEWLTINSIYDENGKVHRRVALFSDVTQKKKSQELIWKQANFDFLTELPNRSMFNDRLAQEIKKSKREGFSMAILLIDLDQFKEVNDTLGHDMGDVLLVEASKRICSCVRESDTVARLGGDEFVIILSELDELSSVERIAREILLKMAQPFPLGNEMAYISASIGITFYPDDSTEIEALLKNADQAMYSAKRIGRNRYSYFTPSMQESAQIRMRLIADLRTALNKEEFQVFYQPIVELATNRIHKAEALIRWFHPTRGLVSPAEFIPLAEETGLIVEIGDWVFAKALEQIKRIRASFDEGFQISVNVSPVQFHNNCLDQKKVSDCLQILGLPGESIILEITEGLLLDANSQVTDQLLTCRDAGVQVSLDDFGTGYSSLSYLKKFDIDFIKIDQSFVANLTPDSNDRVLCEAIVVMAHKLGLKVIAEGIETELQRDLLIAAGCDYGQGYLFSRPVEVDVFDKMIAPTESEA